MIKRYRDNGAYGALLDEYERAIDELKAVVVGVEDTQLITVVDNETKDKDCRSIQSILTHVVQSGYTYAIAIRNHNGEELNYRDKVFLNNSEAYNLSLDKMMEYTVKMMEDYPNMNLEENDNDKKIITRWGQMYNIDQLLEHAIVHILRHRRQIERFLLRL